MSKLVKVAIVGGGPAGLFCAFELLKDANIQVDLYEQTGGVGKKFLVAGNSGLNLTHSENIEQFSSRYGKHQDKFKDYLNHFSPNDLVNWANDLGSETFVGTSGRVFPKKMKAADILYQWMNVLKHNERFKLHLKHTLINILEDGDLVFKHDHSQKIVHADFYVFALGGGSWVKTGSDGKWMEYIEELGVKTQKLLPMNCGFEITWSDLFLEKVDRGFVKNIVVKSKCGKSARGEIMLTPYGIEGGAVYAISNYLRDDILERGQGSLYIDFKPDLSIDKIIQKLSNRSKDSLTNRLRKGLGFDKVSLALFFEVLDRTRAQGDINYLANMIKSFELKLDSTRPIDEAISTSGGVDFKSLNDTLNIKTNEKYFFAGEMLDFEAPTGGYLLQGCFSTAYIVAKSIKEKVNV